MVEVHFPWLHFVFSYYVAPGDKFKTKAWKRICRRQLFLDKHSLESIISLSPFHGIAPIGETIIEVKPTLQLQLVCKWRKEKK